MIGVLGFDSRRQLRIFLFTTASITALGLTQPLIQGVKGARSLGVKRPGCEADHSPPSSAEVKEWMGPYLHSPNTTSWPGAQLKKKHRDNFAFLPYLYLNFCLLMALLMWLFCLHFCDCLGPRFHQWFQPPVWNIHRHCFVSISFTVELWYWFRTHLFLTIGNWTENPNHTAQHLFWWLIYSSLHALETYKVSIFYLRTR
jgi:hypothetical protein